MGFVVAALVVVLVLNGRQSSVATFEPDTTTLMRGHATTRIVEPLAKDGSIDYVAAINAERAPPPEDNAAIPLLRILGTDTINGNRAEVLALLGAPDDLPTKGSFQLPEDYFGIYSDFSDLEEAERALLVEVLQRLQKEIDGLVHASRKPRLWSPMVIGNSDGQLSDPFPIDRLGELCDCLGDRAEVRVFTGKWEEGLEDVKALFRLHTLLDQQGGLLWYFIALSRRQRALDVIQSAVGSSSISEAGCKQAIAVLRELPPMREDLSRHTGVFDRYMVLGSFIGNVTAELKRQKSTKARRDGYALLNSTLAEFNRILDEVVPLIGTLTAENVEKTKRRVDQLSDRVKKLNKDLKSLSLKKIIGAFTESSTSRASETGRQLGLILATMLLVPLPIAAHRKERCDSQLNRVLIALALRLHFIRHGTFPPSLNQLDPPPQSTRRTNSPEGKTLPYELTPNGCRLGTGEEAIELSR